MCGCARKKSKFVAFLYTSDKYITILWDNVLEGAKENFRQYSDPVDDHLGLPYDYGSIMHYQYDAFSKNGNATIIPNYASKEAIGQRVIIALSLVHGALQIVMN